MCSFRQALRKTVHAICAGGLIDVEHRSSRAEPIRPNGICTPSTAASDTRVWRQLFAFRTGAVLDVGSLSLLGDLADVTKLFRFLTGKLGSDLCGLRVGLLSLALL